MAITCRQRFFPTCYGKEFTDRLFGLRKRAATGEHEFDTLCTALEIDHRLTPPKSPQTNGMVERFNGRIEEVLQSHHFRSGEELEATLHRYVWLYNQQLPQSALDSNTPLQAMKNWHKIKPDLFKKQPYYLPGCDTYRILLNLVRNAFDAGARAVRISGRNAGESAVIEMRDDGPGLPEAVAARIGQDQVSGTEGGSGLGLRICHELCRNHGGTLEVAETGPAGTCFRVTLPFSG